MLQIRAIRATSLCTPGSSLRPLAPLLPHLQHVSQSRQKLDFRENIPSFRRALSSHGNPQPSLAKKDGSQRPLSPPPRKGILGRILPPTLVPPPDGVTSFRKLIALAYPERKTLACAIGLLLISSSVSMSVPYTIGRLIDYFSAKDAQLLLNLPPSIALAALLGVFTVGALANSGRVLLMRLAGQRIVARLRERAYSSALQQEVEMVEKDPGVGDIMSRLSTDTNMVGESLTGNLSDGLRALVTASVGMSLMVYLSPKLTLVMLSVVPPIALGSFVYGRYLKKLSNRTQEALGEMSQVAQESLSALRTVQAFSARKWEENKFSEKVANILDLGKKEAWASGIFYGSTGWAGNLTILTLLGYGGTLVSRGEISVGDLTSLLLYSAFVGNALSMLTSFFTTLMRAVGASTRVFSLLERKSAIPTDTGVQLPPGIREGVIKFENVSFEYPSRRGISVLKNFSFTIPVGGSTAIVGKSGSGKSSIQSLLLRFYDPTSGRITFNGQDIREFNVHAWRSMMSIVPQDPVLFAGTIASNIAYGSPETPREEIERAARQANCEFVWDMPNGLDTTIGRSSLSGGQRQRIAIARALLKRPALLCLDEATSALDAVSELRVNEAIEKILESRHTTSIIVAHRLSTISRAERIAVLEDGAITEEGPYSLLALRENSRFRALMDAQLQAAVQDRDALSSYSSSLDGQGQVAEEPGTGAVDAQGVDLFDTGKAQKVEEETPLR
ncbi:hypothetical protein BS47DRAFT_1325025 [Hydnum rufescens UP504]|uniref:ABC transporter n=1 Tax=Hydnum rufescens UP504 TaxID=1448309 RepID=A0A9P6B716_9AGAM|nr:hypothetical protein BS47DRAFT_1325025 [Hydnum rufescens UP504]